jgi:hypothetical protein
MLVSHMNRLDELRAYLTEEQRDVLNTIWRYEIERNRGIPAIALCDEFCADEDWVRTVLDSLGGDVVYSLGEEYARRRYQLTYLGYLLAEQGKSLQTLLARYLTYARDTLRADPETERINVNTAIEELDFSADEKALFSEMFFRTPFHGGGSRTESGFPHRIDDWYSSTDLYEYVGRDATRDYEPNTPLDGGRQKYIRIATPALTQLFGDPTYDEPAEPPELRDSLERFRADYPDSQRVSFVMMRFGKTLAHQKITAAIENALESAGMVAVRADAKLYHDELLSNVLTYVYGCGSGVAVFERLEEQTFNPNVSLEVGYMLALKKPICLLKDKTLKTLHTDLIGRVYKEFDPQTPDTTIPTQLTAWLKDKGFFKEDH